MTRHAVVIYPVLSDVDSAWIEGFRARHDPQAALLAAHATLVFPLVATASVLVAEAAAVARRHAPFRLALGQAIAHRDPDASRVFLVPSAGAAEVAALHDDLYARALRAQLRAGVAYQAHVTVAADADHAVCVRLAAELGGGRLPIAGTAAALDVVAIADGRVSSLATIPLGAGAAA